MGVDNRGFSVTEAEDVVAAEFPAECGPCGNASSISWLHQSDGISAGLPDARAVSSELPVGAAIASGSDSTLLTLGSGGALLLLCAVTGIVCLCRRARRLGAAQNDKKYCREGKAKTTKCPFVAQSIYPPARGSPTCACLGAAGLIRY